MDARQQCECCESSRVYEQQAIELRAEVARLNQLLRESCHALFVEPATPSRELYGWYRLDAKQQELAKSAGEILDKAKPIFDLNGLNAVQKWL